MKKKLPVIILILGLLATFGCGAAHLRNPTKSGGSMVYGYIELHSADITLDWVKIKKMWPPGGKTFYSAGVNNQGVFWHSNIPEGAYQVVSFGNKEKFIGGPDTFYTYSLEKYSSNPSSIEISKPGMYYMGTFKRSGRIFERSDVPSEWMVLEDMLPLSKGTIWEEKIIRRLKELGR